MSFLRGEKLKSEMIWKDELAKLDQLTKVLTNLGADISRQITQYESRKDTLQNELAKLDADYQVICSRNEEAKKEFQKSRRLDLEQFEEQKQRVNRREMALIEKERELQKLKAELEMNIASAKSTKDTIEALGRQHVRK